MLEYFKEIGEAEFFRSPERSTSRRTLYDRMLPHTQGVLRARLATLPEVYSEVPNDYSRVAESGQIQLKAISREMCSLLQREGADFYRYILGLATVSVSPGQLFNTLSLLSLTNQRLGDWDNLIYRNARFKTPEAKRASESLDEFLGSTSSPDKVSPGARFVQEDMCSLWAQEDDAFVKMHTRMAERYRFPNGDIFDHYSYTPKPDNFIIKHFVEGYLVAVLDPATPMELRRGLLLLARRFNFGSNPRANKDLRFDRRYDVDASFWEYAKPQWLFPGLFRSTQVRNESAQNQPPESETPEQEELGRLRWEVTDLRERLQLSLNANKTMVREMGELRSEVERLRRNLLDTEDVETRLASTAKMYQACGGHPLDVLGIDHKEWSKATPSKREALVKSSYRTQARQYHPDSHNVLYFVYPRIKGMFEEKFRQITNASEVLQKRTSESEIV